MGFLSTATTITVTTKLTEAGRKRMLTETNNIFSHFILGDSDANYRTSESLPTGTVPTASGNLGQPNAEKAIITSQLYVGKTLTTKKAVEPNSSQVTVEVAEIGEIVVSGDNLNYVSLNKNDNTVDFTNLFKSLTLPIISTRIDTFTATTAANGGWSNTAFSGFATNRILLAAIDNDQYGELIDGKNIRCLLPIATGYTGTDITGITTYDIYSTFPRTTISRTTLDNSYKDNSTYPTSIFGNNISCAYLVSDNIQRPNNDVTKSWSTGYDMFKPFSVNNKELLNVGPTISASSIFADRVIGIAYLDKGLLAFTDPEIVNNIAVDFSGDSATSAITNSLGLYHYTASTYNTTIESIDNNVIQNILCIANKEEFYRSQNETKTSSDPVRISEVGITDLTGEILAIGKIDRQLIKQKSEVLVLDIEIVV